MYQTNGKHVDRLPGLPDPHVGSGYDWMGELGPHWHAIGVWGQDGWDLGSWPLVIVAACQIDTDDLGPLWGVCTYVEGDLTVESFANRAAFWGAIDKIAEFYWRHLEHGPDDLPEGGGLLPRHRGPYQGRGLSLKRAR